jgi:hypothetical protein
MIPVQVDVKGRTAQEIVIVVVLIVVLAHVEVVVEVVAALHVRQVRLYNKIFKN